jgi:hypothetical protein
VWREGAEIEKRSVKSFAGGKQYQLWPPQLGILIEEKYDDNIPAD